MAVIMNWGRNTKTIKRELLYKQVWEKPVSRLAPEYWISVVDLKKICKKLKVATPPSGYWVKVQRGWKVQPEALPKLKAGDPATHQLEKRTKTKAEEATEHSAEASELIARIKSALPIKVPAQLKNPHPMIVATQIGLKKSLSR